MFSVSGDVSINVWQASCVMPIRKSGSFKKRFWISTPRTITEEARAIPHPMVNEIIVMKKAFLLRNKYFLAK